MPKGFKTGIISRLVTGNRIFFVGCVERRESRVTSREGEFGGEVVGSWLW